MSILSNIKRGNPALPPRIVLAGVEGVGKSTWASNAPSPLFICAEDGLTGLDHVARWQPKDYADLKSFLAAILNEGAGEYKTIVIDTADWLERMIHDWLCSENGKANIEEFGYGKGYNLTESETSVFLSMLDQLRHKHGLGIILLSHVTIRSFNDPAGSTWDRYEMKGNKRFTGLLREWPDCVLFARFEVINTKTKTGGKEREKALDGGRILHTTPNPAWEAKNRLNLPESLELSYTAFDQAVKENTPAALRQKLTELHKTAVIEDATKSKQWADFVAKAETLSPDKLKAAIERLTSLQPASK